MIRRHILSLLVLLAFSANAETTCNCAVCPERANDLVWENDKFGMRAYGPGEYHRWSGFDVFNKNTASNVCIRWMRDSKYNRNDVFPNFHQNLGEGMDNYTMGASRGVGGIAMFADGEWKTYPDWETSRILHTGDDYLEFEIVYPAFSAAGKMTCHITLKRGERFFRNDVSFERMPGDFLVGPGIDLDPKRDHKGCLVEEPGMVSLFEDPKGENGKDGSTMEAIFVADSSQVTPMTDHMNCRVLAFRGKKNFTYWAGASWSLAGEITHKTRGVHMRTRQLVVAQVFLSLCASALATEYFVDANRGNDDWDGTSATFVSGTTGPKKTLQAAADLIPNNNGHIITVLPGVYDEGGAVYPGADYSLTNRLAISKQNVTIRSTGGKEVTHIVGASDSENADGCGPAAVRCVRGPGSDKGTVLIGFTLRDGHNGITSTKNEDRGGGAFDVYLYDCTISNCVSHTRGGAGNNCTFVRCRIIGNTAGAHGMACNSCSLANCLVARNYGSGATLTYTSKMINTSVVGNTGGPALSLGSSGTAVWNCFFAGNHDGQNGFDSAGNAEGAYCTNTVCERQAFFEHVDEASVTNAALGQCVSSALGDAHLVPGSVAINCGDAANLVNITLPAEYEQMDLEGNRLPDSGVINCGCFQQTVTPTGAKLSFNSEFTWDVGEPIPVNKNATHYFTGPAETLKVKPILASDKMMYGLYSASEESNGKNNFRIPMMDGYVRIFANPDPNFVISLNVQEVTRKYYVDAEDGNDGWDGTSATFVSGTTGPKKTLAGVCAVADLKNYNLVYVAPGVYDDGTCDGTVPSRLKVTRPVGFISSGGIGAATIKGGSQVRCAYLGSGNAFL